MSGCTARFRSELDLQSGQSGDRSADKCQTLQGSVSMELYFFKLRTLLLAVFLTSGVVGEAAALSCSPSFHRYFIVCQIGACQGAFVAHDVSTLGPCGRRPVVDLINISAAPIMSALVAERYSARADGIFILELSTDHWETPDPFDLAGLRRALLGGANNSLRLLSTATSPLAVEAYRAGYVAEERRAFRRYLLWNIIGWGIFVGALFVAANVARRILFLRDEK